MYREGVRNENINVNMNANLEKLDKQLTDAQVDELLAIVETKRLALEAAGETGEGVLLFSPPDRL